MSADKYRSLLRWMVGGLVALLVAGGFFAFITRGSAGVAFGPDSLMGWAIPLSTVFVVVAISWFLLAREQGDDSRTHADYAACPSCGQAVAREWRLCPYCGARPPWPPPTDKDPSSGSGA